LTKLNGQSEYVIRRVIMNQMIPKLKQYIMHGFEYSEQFSREPLPQPIKQMESVRKYEEYMTTA